MWCLRGYYFKMAPGTVKKAIVSRGHTEHSYPGGVRHELQCPMG